MMARALLLVGLVIGCGPARSEGGPYDPERHDPRGRPAEIEAESWARPSSRETGRLPRRVDSGPGYVGSDYGLGRPAYTGLGSRPDWGRSE